MNLNAQFLSSQTNNKDCIINTLSKILGNLEFITECVYQNVNEKTHRYFKICKINILTKQNDQGQI